MLNPIKRNFALNTGTKAWGGGDPGELPSAHPQCDPSPILLRNCPTKYKFKLTHIVNAVHGIAATGERQPLHVPPLGPPQAEDPLLGKGVQGEGIHALLVDHDKAFVRSVANLV